MSTHPRPMIAPWWDHAACKGTDWRLWAPLAKPTHPPRDYDLKRYANAAAICADCPVKVQCRLDADAVDDPAFRAGYSHRDRTSQNGGRW